MKILNKLKITLLISLFTILLSGINAFAVTGVVTEITVNMRKEPSTSSKRIMYVTQDDIVEVLEKSGDWYKIKFEGKTGYVLGKYVKVDESKLENVKEETSSNTNTNSEETVKQEETTNEVIQDITADIELKLQLKAETEIRLIPNITSNVIYTAQKNISVKVIDQVNNWMYILVDNNYGWVRADRVIEETQEENKTSTKSEEENSTTEEETTTAYVKYESVNLREKASTSSKVVAKLKLNDEVTVLEKTNNNWSKIKFDGKTGYISTELLADEKQKETEKTTTTSRDGESTTRTEVAKEETTSTTNKKEETTTQENSSTTIKNETVATTSSTKGEEIVEYAKKYLNYSYKSGGTSPKTGFDCSGFTYYVYKHFGYTLSRTSSAQAKNGKSVDKKDLQPGDLIIFKNQSLTAIGHVGIYIGNNKIIHASEPGVGVTITNMDASGYNYNKRYVTARRII